MPNSGSDGITGVIGGKLHVLTSCSDEDNCFPVSGDVFFYRYDPPTDGWTVLPRPPSAHRAGAGGVVGGRFYVAGGSFNPTQLDVYDPATNRWITKSPAPDDLGIVPLTLRAKLYVSGAGNTRVYDPATDAWTSKAPMPPRSGAVGAGKVVVNGQPRIEVVGGSRPGNNLAYLP
jgi:N-acetylneuraminic acid mutarotase